MPDLFPVLLDEDSDARADERCYEILKSQDEQLSTNWEPRIGMVEYQTPRLRRAYYAAHQPVFAVQTTLDEWLDAYDHREAREAFLQRWAAVIPALYAVYVPPGPQMGPVDPMTGQQTVLSPGPPNYELRLQLWGLAQQRVLTTGVIEMGDVLMPYYRELYHYDPAPLVRKLRDMRKMEREQNNWASSNGATPQLAGVY